MEMPFDEGTVVDVEEITDKDWRVLTPIRYHGITQTFDVPKGDSTDFASVPRALIWFLPRYGRYTKAAVLHDHLWRKAVPDRELTLPEADAIFRRAMRELGVPFLRRWIMWAAVRLGALTNPAGRKKWWKEAWRVALIAAIALPIVAPAAAVIVITLLVFYLVELLVWIPLEAAYGIRKRRRRPAKKVNRPA